MKSEYLILIFSILLGILFWLLDAGAAFLLFREGKTFLEALILEMAPHEIHSRMSVLVLFVVFGLVTSLTIRSRKRTEKMLLEERSRAQEYLAIVGVMILVIGEDQKVRLINERGCQILGYELEEIIGKNWFDNFLPKRIREEGRTHFKELLKGNIEHQEYYEDPILTKNGNEKLIFWHNTLLKNEEGRIYATLSSGEDITKLRKVENELRESKNQYQSIIDNIQDGITIIEEGKVVFVNNRACEIFGCPKDELMKLRYTDFLAPEEKKRVQQIFEEAKQTGVHPKEIEFWIIRGDGTRCFVNSRYTISQIEGKRHTFIVTSDFTERKMTEELRRRVYEQIEKNIENFATLIDEIRNPLSVIQGLADLKDDEESQIIVQQAERIEQIMKQLDKGWLESEKVREFLRKRKEEITEESKLF